MVEKKKHASKGRRLKYPLITFIFITMMASLMFNQKLISNIYDFENDETKGDNYKISPAIWATFNLTNNWIDGDRYFHGDIIPIRGRLFNRIPVPSGVPKVGYNVELIVNGQQLSQYGNTTDSNGVYRISYAIPNSTNIYSYLNISAIVTDAPGVVEYVYSDLTDHYIIYTSANSHFGITTPDLLTPYLTGEDFPLSGNLNYDNGSGIPNIISNTYWYDNIGFLVAIDTYSTTGTGVLQNIGIPEIGISNSTLKLSYSDFLQVNYSEIILPNIKLFQDVAWSNMDVPATGVQGASYTVSGQLFSSTDPLLKISNREVKVLYNGSMLLDSVVQTDINGTFSSTFTLPMAMGNGTHTIQVDLTNSAGKVIRSITYIITVNSPAAAPTSPSGGAAPLPFAEFFMFFIPILIGVIAALAAYGYYFLKKQKEDAQVVSIPLEDKIRNLKILKDTGRLEESLSYLFNAIFMELISARFGREKKEFETIRDFAIVSVKELGLKATVVYPFMTKVESIIYNQPFIFSPVYFELTGHNFILNF